MSGSNGNESGRIFESIVGDILLRHCISRTPQYTTNVIGGLKKRVRVDFYLYEDNFYIEARWQDKSGSVDAKNVALVNDVKDYYDKPTIIVFGGTERHRSIEYCKERKGVGNLHDGMDIDEFITWCGALSSKSITTTTSYDARQMTLYAM